MEILQILIFLVLGLLQIKKLLQLLRMMIKVMDSTPAQQQIKTIMFTILLEEGLHLEGLTIYLLRIL